MDEVNGENRTGEGMTKTVSTKAKKRPVIESDDDDSDLDFCEESPFKKAKK